MALISPDEWLHEVSTARRAATGPLRGVTQPGVVLGWGSAAFVCWLAVACVVGLLVVEGLDWGLFLLERGVSVDPMVGVSAG